MPGPVSAKVSTPPSAQPPQATAASPAVRPRSAGIPVASNRGRSRVSQLIHAVPLPAEGHGQATMPCCTNQPAAGRPAVVQTTARSCSDSAQKLRKADIAAVGNAAARTTPDSWPRSRPSRPDSDSPRPGPPHTWASACRRCGDGLIRGTSSATAPRAVSGASACSSSMRSSTRSSRMLASVRRSDRDGPPRTHQPPGDHGRRRGHQPGTAAR